MTVMIQPDFGKIWLYVTIRPGRPAPHTPAGGPLRQAAAATERTAATKGRAPADRSRDIATASVANGAVFSTPSGTQVQQDAIENRLIQLINGAARGSDIRPAIYFPRDGAVVVQGSGDISPNTRLTNFNEAVTFTRNTALYAAYQHYFNLSACPRRDGQVPLCAHRRLPPAG